MDPVASAITLSKTLVKVLINIKQRFDDIDRFSELELQSAQAYRLALSSLSNEVDDVKDFFEAEGVALSPLLNSPGIGCSLRRLIGALDIAERLCEKRIGHADDLIRNLQNQERSIVAFGDRDHGNFNRRLEIATKELEHARDQVSRRFGAFRELWRNTSRISRSRPDNQRATLQLAFHKHPFNIILGESTADEIAASIITSDEDMYALLVQDMAEKWVNDKLASKLTVQNFGQAQSDILMTLSKVLSTEMKSIESAKEVEFQRYARMNELRDRADIEIERERSKRFSIAFCGLSKAGKSTLLNALVGRTILPSDELPSTAWPCRIRHVKGKREPTLTIDLDYFQSAIENIRNQLEVPADNNDFSLLDGPQSATTLHETISTFFSLETKKNLHRFERENYCIPEHASGYDDVKDLLGQVNDIVRVSSLLNVGMPEWDTSRWSRLEVEFEALQDEHVEGDFEFIDLPGLGQYQSSPSGNYFTLEEMVRHVAKEVSDVVPVVSLKEAAKSEWKIQLAQLIEHALGRPPELALCTHLDQVKGDVEQLCIKIARGFKIASSPPKARILRCGTLLGLSAREALRQSEGAKLDIKSICADPIASYSILFKCATKVLGEGNPNKQFEILGVEGWQDALRKQLDKSELQHAIDHLVKEMVISSPKRTLKREGDRILRLLQSVIYAQRPALLSADARRRDQDLIKQYQSVLGELSSSRRIAERDALGIFMDRSERYKAKGCKAAEDAVEEHMRNEDQRVFYDVSEADNFLRPVMKDLCEQLLNIKREFVRKVRCQADDYMRKLFEQLEKTFGALKRDDLQDEIINELQGRGANVEELFFSLIRSDILAGLLTKPDALSRLRLKMWKLVHNQKPIDAFFARTIMGGEDISSAEKLATRIERSGFIRGAPQTEIRPFSPLKLFTKRSERYVVEKKYLVKALKDRTVLPFHCGLEKEGEQTLKQMMKNSFEAAKNVVDEKQREQCENASNQQSAALAVSKLLSFIAAEAALKRLQKLVGDDFGNS